MSAPKMRYNLYGPKKESCKRNTIVDFYPEEERLELKELNYYGFVYISAVIENKFQLTIPKETLSVISERTDLSSKQIIDKLTLKIESYFEEESSWY